MTIYEKLIAALLATILAGATITTATETRKAVDKMTQVIYNEEAIIEMLDNINEDTTSEEIERGLLNGKWSIDG